MTAVIELEGLCVTLGGRPVLLGLDGALTGRVIGLLGPNGAGKTTLVNTLLGFHKPRAGSARIFGFDTNKQATSIRGLVGYMPERDAFIAGMSGVRFLRMMGELAGLPSDQALERAHETMFYVGLGEARYRKMESYSLGMKQLVKLAQALMHGPRLLFLDEPTNGLDPPSRATMLRLIRDIAENTGIHIMLSSHILRDVEICCEEVVILKDGRLVEYCNLEAERRANRNFLEMEIRGNGEPFSKGLVQLGCEVATLNRRRLKAVLPDNVGLADIYQLAHTHEVQIRTLNHKQDSLEDLFFKAMEVQA